MYQYSSIRLLLVVIATLWCSPLLRGQKQPDAGLWCTFNVEKKITKKLFVGLVQEFRLRENYSRLNLLYTNPYVSYKFKKGLGVSGGYRFINKYMYQMKVISFRHRLMFDVTYKKKLKKLDLDDLTVSYRSRLQGEVRDFDSSPEGHSPEFFWRNKFELKYNLGKIDPYLGTELRYQIYDPRALSGNYGWHRARTYCGVDYKINSSNSIGIMFLLQQEFDVDDPNTGYILGLEYAVSL